MWNFNNGSKLREYAHADDKLEIVSVGRDEWREHSRVRGWLTAGGMSGGSAEVGDWLTAHAWSG